MTTQAQEPRAADPRIGPLLDLVQGVLAGYGELATTFAENVPDPEARQRLLRHTQNLIIDARTRYSAIAIATGQ
ncbi:hypothetical protein ACIGZJ_30825 [Kitasatospora sp. NPDC052868]|uniref:hypothetical protein n=1 Tax=Kitasatospora sp. NPDC052868 TaxID=3364060 RepID=UPI0037CBA41F